jgi:hypothetical protein
MPACRALRFDDGQKRVTRMSSDLKGWGSGAPEGAASTGQLPLAYHVRTTRFGGGPARTHAPPLSRTSTTSSRRGRRFVARPNTRRSTKSVPHRASHRLFKREHRDRNTRPRDWRSMYVPRRATTAGSHWRRPHSLGRGGWSGATRAPGALLPGGEEQDDSGDDQSRRPEQIEIDPATAQERKSDPLVHQHRRHPGHDERGEGVHPDRGQRDRQ